MKKITILNFLLISSICFSQTWSTGEVILDSDYSVQFDINGDTDIVTMTMIGPDDRWLGVSINDITYNSGNGMGQFSGEDTFTFVNNAVNDRSMPSMNGLPPLDSQQDWSIVSNTTSGGERTVVASRARDTGDANDFVFQEAAVSNLTIVWAKGAANSVGSIAYHSGGRGATLANITLSNDIYNLSQRNLSLYPNPANSILKVNIQNVPGKIQLKVYDTLGKLVLEQYSEESITDLNISGIGSGVYIINILSDDFSETRRFVKN